MCSDCIVGCVLQWSPDSQFILCAMYKRSLIQVCDSVCLVFCISF